MYSYGSRMINTKKKKKLKNGNYNGMSFSKDTDTVAKKSKMRCSKSIISSLLTLSPVFFF